MNVDLECQVPLFIGYVCDLLEACLVRGIVDEDVETAQF